MRRGARTEVTAEPRGSAACPRDAMCRARNATETPGKRHGARAASAFNRRVDRANLLFAPTCFLSREPVLGVLLANERKGIRVESRNADRGVVRWKKESPWSYP